MDTQETVGQGPTEDTVQGADQQVTDQVPAPSNNSGQGFLDQYLQEVPEEHREIVHPILDKYRKDQDANFNKRFEQLQEEARVPTMIHQALVQDPLTTLNWIADRIQEEQGINVRQELLQRWADTVGDNPQVQSQEGQGQEDPNKPLTAQDIDRILEERERQKQEQTQQEQAQRAQFEEQQKTLTNWIDTAAKSYSLPLDDSQGEDPLRAVIIMQANQIHESGVAKGQAAVEMAVESVAKRFGSIQNGSEKTGKVPPVAEGGSAPPSKPIDVSDKAQRIARMTELFGAST